jgi:hypothetical protein
MAGLGGTIPNFDGLLDSDQPKDTEVTIVEEGSPTAPSSKKRSRQGTPDNHITVQAHWVVLRSLSPYFQAKVRLPACLSSASAGMLFQLCWSTSQTCTRY